MLPSLVSANAPHAHPHLAPAQTTMFWLVSLCANSSLERSSRQFPERSAGRPDTVAADRRGNRRVAYVNKPHTRAAFFVHDHGEKVRAEHRIELCATSIMGNRCNAILCGAILYVCRSICLGVEH
jgi:hypothetical protein